MEFFSKNPLIDVVFESWFYEYYVDIVGRTFYGLKNRALMLAVTLYYLWENMNMFFLSVV